MNTENYSFKLILHSGNARSLAYEALSLVKENKFADAYEKIKEAKAELLLAQKVHASLISNIIDDKAIVPDLLLIHAEDHVSSSALAVDMSTEIIELYKRLEVKDAK